MTRNLNINRRCLIKILIYFDGISGSGIENGFDLNKPQYHSNLLNYLFKNNKLKKFDFVQCLRYTIITKHVSLFKFVINSYKFRRNIIENNAEDIFTLKLYDLMHLIIPYVNPRSTVTIKNAIFKNNMNIIKWHKKFAPRIFSSEETLLLAIGINNFTVINYLVSHNRYYQYVYDVCVEKSVDMDVYEIFELLVDRITMQSIVNIISMLTKDSEYTYTKYKIFELLAKKYNSIDFRHKCYDGEFEKKYVLTINNFSVLNNFTYYM